MFKFDPRNQLLSDITSGINSITSLSNDISESDKSILENVKLNIPKLDTNTLFMIREYVTSNLQSCLSNYFPVISSEKAEDELTEEFTTKQESSKEGENENIIDKLTNIFDYSEEIVELVQNSIDNVSDMDIITQLINIKLFINEKLDEFNKFTNDELSDESNMKKILTQLDDFKIKLEGYSKLIENITDNNNNQENSTDSVELEKDKNLDELNSENKETVIELSSTSFEENENSIEPETDESININDQIEEIKKTLGEISENISTNNPEMSTSLETVQEKIDQVQTQISNDDQIEPESDDILDDDFEPTEDDNTLNDSEDSNKKDKKEQSIEEQLQRMSKVLKSKPIQSDKSDNSIIMPSKESIDSDESNDKMKIVQDLRNLSFKYGKPEFEKKPEMDVSELLYKLSESIEDDDEVNINNNIESITTMVNTMNEIVKNEIMDIVNKVNKTSPGL
jgi:hypothetical protein